MVGQFVFAGLVVTAAVLSWLTESWRLKTVSLAFVGIWLISTVFDRQGVEIWWLDPAYSFMMIALIFAIQSRGKVEREQQRPYEMWILIPLACEIAIAMTYVFQFTTGEPAAFYIMQGVFMLEISAIILVALRLSRPQLSR